MNTTTFNQDWQDLAPIIKRSFIAADHEFYKTAVDQFKLTIVDDETDKWEKPYEAVLEAGFVDKAIEDVLDLMGFFLHASSHQRCDIFWQQCPVPMDMFTPHQLDFIEEVYNQRLVSVVAPDFHSAFPIMNARYDEYKGVDVAKRRPLQTMFSPNCDTGVDILNALHAWLYRNNPLSQQTFDTYMRAWFVLIDDPYIVQIIVDYES
jgi:hypothetical protein